MKQNGNRDYIVSEHDRVICVSREGKLRWEYKVRKMCDYGLVEGVYALDCDKFDNIIIADCKVNKVLLLNSEGDVI